MIRLAALLLLTLACAPAVTRAAESPAPSPAPLEAVNPANPAEAWKPVIAGLAKVRRIESGFVENRYHRIRKLPFTSPGTMRYEPGTGVSLARTTDNGEEVVLVKPDGLYRKENGRFAKIPYDVAATRAPRVMLAVVAFDADRVAKDFITEGRLTADGWHLELRPRDPELAKIVSKLSVEGAGDRLNRITIHDGEFVRLDIFIHKVDFPEAFSDRVRRDYFGA